MQTNSSKTKLKAIMPTVLQSKWYQILILEG